METGIDSFAAKIMHHSEALGGISRVTFQLDTGSLPHDTLMNCIRLIGQRIAPLLRG